MDILKLWSFCWIIMSRWTLRTKYGLIALQWAAFEVHQDIERLLISNGAQEPKDFYGFHAMFGAITAKAVGRCEGVDLQALLRIMVR
jgi:hypothetical protein